MAIARTRPKCFMCGEFINGIYKDQSKIPFMLKKIGDTFQGWDYKSHKCNEDSKQYKQYLKDKKEYQNSKEGKDTYKILQEIFHNSQK